MVQDFEIAFHDASGDPVNVSVTNPLPVQESAAGALRAVRNEVVTVGTTAVGLTAGTVGAATYARLTLEAAQIRMWEDGTAPTATQGQLVYIGDVHEIAGNANLLSARFIRDTAATADGKLMVQYYEPA